MRCAEYYEGVAAFRAGQSIESNPYEKAEWDGCRTDWDEGWRAAQADEVQEEVER